MSEYNYVFVVTNTNFMDKSDFKQPGVHQPVAWCMPDFEIESDCIQICDWILENQPKCHTRPIPFYWPS